MKGVIKVPDAVMWLIIIILAAGLLSGCKPRSRDVAETVAVPDISDLAISDRDNSFSCYPH